MTGLLVRPDDPSGFAAATTELVADESRRFGFAAAAREHALTRDATREDGELLAHYAELAGCAERRSATCAA